MSAPILQLRRLYYFVEIAEFGSFTGASKALRVAQPALTHHMRELERELQVKLLLRSHRGTSLTEAGRLLLDHARRILGAASSAEMTLRKYRMGLDESHRSLHVAVIPSLAGAVTPRLFAAARDDARDLRLHVSEVKAHESEELLKRGQVDLAVTIAVTPPPDALLLAWESILFVSSPQVAGSDRGPIAIAEALRHPLILPSSASYTYGAILENFARREGHEIRIDTLIDGLGPRKQAVIAGLGSTFLTKMAISQEVRDGQLVARPLDPPLRRAVVLRERGGLDPETSDWIRSTLRRLLD